MFRVRVSVRAPSKDRKLRVLEKFRLEQCSLFRKGVYKKKTGTSKNALVPRHVENDFISLGKHWIVERQRSNNFRLHDYRMSGHTSGNSVGPNHSEVDLKNIDCF
jgi:hypothetical protein